MDKTLTVEARNKTFQKNNNNKAFHCHEALQNQ